MLLGADTLVPVTHRVDGTSVVDLVRQHYGGVTPLFWGRYFKRPGFADDYQPASEGPILRDNNIQLLPIARQTNRVGGTATQGAQDAVDNVDAFVQSLGVESLAKIGGELLMFLDVEGTSAQNPNLSTDYWIGWSAAPVNHSRSARGGRSPAVPRGCGRKAQSPPWQAIADADRLGFRCTGAWVFRMHTDACTKPLPNWEPAFNTPALALPRPLT